MENTNIHPGQDSWTQMCKLELQTFYSITVSQPRLSGHNVFPTYIRIAEFQGRFGSVGVE